MCPSAHFARPDSTRKPPGMSGAGWRKTVHSSSRTPGSSRCCAIHSVSTRCCGRVKLIAVPPLRAGQRVDVLHTLGQPRFAPRLAAVLGAEHLGAARDAVDLL